MLFANINKLGIMKKPYVFFLMAALAVACSSGFVIPEPVNGTPVTPETPEQPETPDEPEDPEQPEDPDKIIKDDTEKVYGLVADGNDEGTYALITAAGYGYETPDTSGEHAEAPFRHIKQSYDKRLKKNVFDFYLHIDNDDDRGKANVTDRQRNEIKTDGHSPDSLVAQYGETLQIRWKFRLPAGMKTTTKFSHIHQLKGIDNKEGTADVSLPAITFTCRSLSSGKQQMQVLYTASNVESNGATTYLARADLADFLDEWVSVTETVTFADEGSYSVVINRMYDGKELVKVENYKLDLWRTGCTGMRPKWGLYRNFGEKRSMADQLRDEILKFADFSIHKIK